MSLNQCIFSGRLTDKPELRVTNTGKNVCSFSIAVNEGYGDNRKVTYPKITVWGKQAEYVAEYGEKGMLIEVVSKYNQKKYQNDKGQDVHSHDFVATDVQLIFEKNSSKVNKSYPDEQFSFPAEESFNAY